MVKDLNPLTTPNSVLTDALNATLITFNGNEFILQNDMGNGIVERAKLSPGFIPMGIKQYGGIIYVASYNPETLECEVGSFPSPERDITGSNKIEFQTGLRDGNFSTDQFSIPIIKDEDFEPDESNISLRKLNQQEILQLSPGDLFVITYEIKNPGIPSAGQQTVVNTTGFNNFFSQKEDDKKTFSINFYKIDDSNNVKDIGEKNIIYHTGALEEDSFEPYTENNRGSIAVGLELNTLTRFNAAVRETSRISDENKKIRIEAIGSSDSDVLFKGVLVEILRTKVDGTTDELTFHIEKESDLLEKVSMDVEDLATEEVLNIDVTPYTQYGYLPKLTKSFKLKMGEVFGTGNVTDIFKWRVLDDLMELDFDFKYNTEENLSIYLEFYDTWSNYSVITRYDSPSFFGSMRLNIPLINEPRTEIFDNDQLGGTKLINLRDNEDSINIPVMIDPSKSNNRTLVRNEFTLRKNHFYLVRICGIERFLENGEITDVVYNDVYKALYTNVAFNDIYEEQINLSLNDVDFKGDFTKLKYPAEDINYNAEVNSNAVNTTSVLGSIPNDIPTTLINGNRRLFKVGEQPVEEELTISDVYNSIQNHNLQVSLGNGDLVYGRLKNGVLSLETPNNTITLTSNNIKEEVQVLDLPQESEGTINIPNITGEGTYNVSVATSTKRKVNGQIVKDDSTAPRLVEDKTLDDLLYKSNISHRVCSSCSVEGSPSCQSGTQFSLARTCYLGNRFPKGPCERATRRWGINFIVVDHINNLSFIISAGRDLDDVVNKGDVFDSPQLEDYQFFLASTGSYMQGMSGASQLVFRARGIDGTIDARTVVFQSLSEENGIRNPSEVSSILSNFVVQKLESGISNNYYIDPNNLKYHDSVYTAFENLKVELISKFNVISKTYIFESIFKAISDNYTEFSTQQINAYIDSLNTGHNNIISSLDDNGFIPFATDTDNFEKNISFNLPDIIITKAINTNTLNTFVNSSSEYADYVSRMGTEVDDFDEDFPVKSLDQQPDSIDFAKMFRWVNNELNIDPARVTIKTCRAFTGWSDAATTIRTYDMISTPKFPA